MMVGNSLRIPQRARAPASGPIAPARQTDADLVRRVAAGDLAALGPLYDRHHEAVRHFLVRALGDASDADDLAQEAFLTLGGVASRYDGRASARPFLIGIAAQLVRRRRRSFARWGEIAARGRAILAPDRSDDTPERAASDRERMQRFEAALARITEEKRLVVLMMEREGMSGEEIARALQIPVNTVWTRLHGARADLRKALARDEEAGADPTD